MLALDPRWLSIELEAIQRDAGEWDKVLKDSYNIAVQRVFEYQAMINTAPNRSDAWDYVA
jgi:hypothetical protein